MLFYKFLELSKYFKLAIYSAIHHSGRLSVFLEDPLLKEPENYSI
jgi:hypothetical protein